MGNPSCVWSETWLKVGLETSHWINHWGHLPSISGMKETKDIENKEESLYGTGRDTGMTCPFFESTYYTNMSPSVYVCRPVHQWRGLCPADFTKLDSLKINHLNCPNRCINPNPNIVITNSICQGTFLDRSALQKVALSQALSAVSLLNKFVFLLNH